MHCLFFLFFLFLPCIKDVSLSYHHPTPLHTRFVAISSLDSVGTCPALAPLGAVHGAGLSPQEVTQISGCNLLSSTAHSSLYSSSTFASTCGSAGACNGSCHRFSTRYAAACCSTWASFSFSRHPVWQTASGRPLIQTTPLTLCCSVLTRFAVPCRDSVMLSCTV